MKKYLFYLVFSCLSLISFSLKAQQAIIGVSPVEVFLSGQPGSSTSQEVWISNKGSGAFLFECEFFDYWFQGQKRVAEPLGTFKERQAGAWVQCSPNRLLIPAKRRQKIELIAAIPKGLEGDQFAVFYAKMLPPESIKDPSKASVSMTGRIGIKVVVTPLGTQKPEAEIVEAVVKPQKRFQVFQAKLKNLGNVHLMGEGNLVLESPTATIPIKSKVVLEFTFPGMTQEIKATLIDKVPAGHYKGLLTIAPNHKSGSTIVKEFPVVVE